MHWVGTSIHMNDERMHGFIESIDQAHHELWMFMHQHNVYDRQHTGVNRIIAERGVGGGGSCGLTKSQYPVLLNGVLRKEQCVSLEIVW